MVVLKAQQVPDGNFDVAGARYLSFAAGVQLTTALPELHELCPRLAGGDGQRGSHGRVWALARLCSVAFAGMAAAAMALFDQAMNDGIDRTAIAHALVGRTLSRTIWRRHQVRARSCDRLRAMFDDHASGVAA